MRVASHLTYCYRNCFSFFTLTAVYHHLFYINLMCHEWTWKLGFYRQNMLQAAWEETERQDQGGIQARINANTTRPAMPPTAIYIFLETWLNIIPDGANLHDQVCVLLCFGQKMNHKGSLGFCYMQMQLWCPMFISRIHLVECILFATETCHYYGSNANAYASASPQKLYKANSEQRSVTQTRGVTLDSNTRSSTSTPRQIVWPHYSNVHSRTQTTADSC